MGAEAEVAGATTMFSARTRRVSTLQRHATTPSVGLQIDVVAAGGAALNGP